MMKKNKAIIDDGCNPEIVRGAEFDWMLEIPKIKPLNEIIIPSDITPFSMRSHAPSFSEAIGFYEMDVRFSNILQSPENYINELKQFNAVISPDCSLYRNAPLIVQITNIYRNRAIGYFYQKNGLYVIPQVRWGNEYTYTNKYFGEKIAFLGVEKHSIVAIGTYGCIAGKDNRYHFKAGLDAMLETLEPQVLMYGAMPLVTVMVSYC